MLALLAGLGYATVRSKQESRRQLEQRFELRTELAASFASSYARSIVKDERRLALQWLAGRRPSRAQFERVAEGFGFQAVVLLDRDGRLLQIWPRSPELLDTRLGGKYAHLRLALRGKVGVSNVVSSPSEGRPVVAFAVPYSSSAGRRVFSGAFELAGTPLAAYLHTAVPISGGELTLVDETGTVVVGAAAKLNREDANLAAAAGGHLHGVYRRDGEARFFVRQPVAGTPWQMVSSVPERQLLAPVGGAKSLLPWLLFGAFALAALSAAILLWRLAEHRSRLARANQQLERSNVELRDLDRLKDEFVALVSHELRTPLTSIIGYVSALQRGHAGEMSAEQRKLMDVVERNSQRLVRLVGDLLLAAKSDAGKLTLEPEPVDIELLVKQVVESARPHADGQKIDLLLSGTSSAPVFADRARLVQVLDNLLSNAIKFTPAGGLVEVGLTTRADQAVVEIRDSGIGIPPAEQEHLFRRFFRASTATSREIPGTGLGLSIVKTIVDLHEGTIACASREGAGTTFTVTLPLRPAERAAA